MATAASLSKPIDPNVIKWSEFNDAVFNKQKTLPKPYGPVQTLVDLYLDLSKSDRSVLDIGCETGKNAICLIKGGHKVTLLDIVQNAIDYTLRNLSEQNISHGVDHTIVGKIEDLEPNEGPFKAVIGTYVFSFILPSLFEKVMKENVLSRIEMDGYFAGGFFGAEHAWASDPDLSICTIDKLQTLFHSMGFVVLKMSEEKQEVSTAFEGIQLFHTIEVIAKRSLVQLENL